MSFTCRLTSINKTEFKRLIRDLYSMMKINKSKSVAMLICIWILEYFRAWWFIDTDDDVVDKEVQRRLHRNGMGNIVALFLTYVQLRNELVHTPYIYNRCNKTAADILRCNTHETIQKFCSVFEEDTKEFELIYKDVMKTLGLYEVEDLTSRDEMRRIFDEPIESIDVGF